MFGSDSRPRVLIRVDGAHGNTAVLLRRAKEKLQSAAEVADVVLASGVSYADGRPE